MSDSKTKIFRNDMYEKTKLYYNNMDNDLDIKIKHIKYTKKICKWLKEIGDYESYEDVQKDIIVTGEKTCKEGYCKCGHYINEHHHIHIKSLNITEYIGNECIYRFIRQTTNKKCIKTCMECSKPHNNRLSIHCNDCRKKCTSCKTYITDLTKPLCTDCLKNKCVTCYRNSKYKNYTYCYKCLPIKQQLKEWLKEDVGFGKYKNISHRELIKNHSNYCQWIINLENPTGNIKDLQNMFTKLKTYKK